MTYEYKTVNGITEPTKVLGPVPAGVSCTAGLAKGCRALEFVYATTTTAKGDGSNEWGEYAGRLKEVTFTAWNPATSKMTTTSVAQYTYDKEGKLRGTWAFRSDITLQCTLSRARAVTSGAPERKTRSCASAISLSALVSPPEIPSMRS